MDARTFVGSRPGSLCLSAVIFAMMAGCETAPVTGIKTQTEVEIAVAAVKDEWLKECEGLPALTPGNEVGNLLEEYTDVAGLLATCIARHNDSVRYIKPIVQKARGVSNK